MQPDIFPYKIDDATLKKASRIRLLALDVDGVLTNGNLYFSAGGESMKEFSILDGLGVKLLHGIGVQTAIITGRLSGMVSKRMQELGISLVLQGREDKLTALQELQASTGIPMDETGYVGDDLPDLAAIQSCEFGVAVANAHPVVKYGADWVCSKRGGRGAVREVADVILYAQGRYPEIIKHYCARPLNKPLK